MRTEPGFSHRFLSTASTGIPLRDLFNSCRINEERNQWTDSLPHFTKDLRLPRKTIQAIEKIQVNNSGSGNNGKLSVKKKKETKMSETKLVHGNTLCIIHRFGCTCLST